MGTSALAAGRLLTACGGSSASAQVDAGAKASLKGKTISLLVNQPHVIAFKDVLAKQFEKEFGGTLKVTAAPYDQLTSKQILDVQSGAGQFDVFDYFYFGLGSLVAADALVDLTAWIKSQSDIDTGDFLRSIWDPYTLYDGKRYGLPFDGDTHILFYNAKVFDTYKLDPPKTWDDYDAAVEKITKDSHGKVYGAVIEGQQVPMILGCTFINRLAGYGGSLVDSDGKPDLNTDEAVQALTGLINVSKYALPTPLQIGFDQANSAFLSGQGAMIDTWTDMALKASDPSMSKVVDAWDAVPLPVGGSNTKPRTALDAGFGLGVSAGSQQQVEAAEFVKWATSKANNLAVASKAGTGIDPARTSVLNDAAYKKSLPRAYDTIRTGLVGDPLAWPAGPDDPAGLQAMCDEIALAIQGKKSAEQALSDATDQWRKGASG
ncbi:sugar ABC transporter substrate-binding protein [Nocardioides sp. KR10-350]|uniref:ABC transporter substrate-binding protein n=1 Tax=Nocardioides cheoyonin TaxID=3156615 RepID=UPI0032B4347A